MFKKTLSLLLCLALMLGAASAFAASGSFTGEGEGFSSEEKIKVTITLEDGKITDVKVDSHAESDGIADPALEQIPAAIVEKNSADVDVAAGATWTSKGIIAAVKDALEKAGVTEEPAADSVSGSFTGEGEGFSSEEKIKVTVTLDNGKITDVKVDSHAESDGIADPALEQIPAAIVEKNSAEVDVAAGATWTSKGIMAAVAAALESAGIKAEPATEAPAEEATEAPAAEATEAPAAEEPAAWAGVSGTFTGEAEGFSSEEKIKVTVTLDNGKITAVVVDSHAESDGIADPALEQIPAAIVENNTPDVDVAAGATWTSKGIIAAVKDALETAVPAGDAPAGGVSGTFTGEAEGFSSEEKIKVTVTLDNGKITAVVVDSHAESDGIADPALEQIPAAIVENNTPDVDVAAGATWTSKGIIAAVKDALEKAGAAPGAAEEEAKEPVVIEAAEAFIGLGVHNSGRIGPGKDDKDVQVYSINQVFAGVLFDADGKILYAKLDQLEVASPNYDGDGMPHFAGFPGQLPYLYDEDHDGKIDGVMETDNDGFQADIAGWQTKRERGSAYKMNSGTWESQMDAYEAFFVGKTVAELEELFERVFSSHNGRPLKDGSTNEEDKAKYDALSDEDKKLLADVTTGATMSLNDSHGNLLAALKAAYENRQPVAASAASLGLGFDFSGRIGPGKDNTDTQVYSINQVIALTLFDADGKIVQSVMDQIEVATPNYDGAGMPHFSGFLGQGGYNYDFNHDEIVDGKLVTNNDGFQAEIAGWQTKRERGNSYKMNSGTWASEMDAYQAFFAGKTLDELDELFARVFSSRNGRPLKDGSTNEEDKAKYDALSDEDKALLADVTTGATMSLNDSHGNLLGALRNSLDKKLPVELTIAK